MRRLLGAAGFVIGCGLFAGMVSAQPAPQVVVRDPAQLQELFNRKPPALPHEVQPDRWPQPDYFAEALKLTGQKPPERAALPRVRSGAPRHVVLPVQTQAFGFAAPFRALLGAQLDLLLEERGIEASNQTDAVDVHGPFVRRFDEPALVALLQDVPERRLVLLHAGHDGIDRMFLTLVLRDRAGVRVANESVPLPEDSEAALRAAAAALPSLLASVGLAGTNPAAAAGPPEACRAEHWQLGAVVAGRSARQQACQALVAGLLLPDFGGEWPPMSLSTPARLAWLARAHVYALRSGVDDATGRAIHALTLRPLGLATGLVAAVPSTGGDPVVARLGRLENLPLVEQAPVRSTRDARARLVADIARELPPFAAALVAYRAELLDTFGAIDLCELERRLPGTMLRARCRAAGEAAPGAPARAATPFELLAFQEWRLASYHRELYRLSGAQGRRAAAEAFAAALPADVAAHPFMQRQWVWYVDRGAAATSFDAELANARRSAERVLADIVTVQRADEWARRSALSEGLASPNLNIVNDARMRALADDDLRLFSVLKFDRFGADAPPAERRRAGERAFFLVPEAGMVRAAQMQMQRERMLSQALPPVAAGSAAAPVRRQPFGDGRADLVRGPEQTLVTRLDADPLHMPTRIALAYTRLKRGLPLPEAIALIDARPENSRRDDRISESHDWADAGHAFFFAGEPDAARGFYEKVLRIGSGSDSELQARSRVPLMVGRFAEALEASQRRLQRYDSDFVRRDVAGLQFMRRQSGSAWKVLEPRLATSQAVQLWHAVLVGHRIEGADQQSVDTWLAARQLDQAQIDYVDVDRLYHYLLAAVDRVPGEAELARLKRARSRFSGTHPRLAASALLLRAALTGAQHAEARKAVVAVIADDNGSFNRFLLPQFTWAAWQATQGQEPLLAEVRAVDLDADFEGLLAKSMLLALEGQVDESLKFLKAARYELSQIGLGSHALQSRPLPAAYEWALASHLMQRRTGRDEYRQELLRFVRGYQRVQPYFGWLYALEALHERGPAARQIAACRARFLDPNSYFLAEAKLTGLDDARCKPHLW